MIARDKPQPLRDYAFISNLRCGALVGKNGSIDWLCFPRFDSDACLARLIGDDKNGFWQIMPVEKVLSVSRSYLADTAVLETCFKTASGEVHLIDFMPTETKSSQLIRVIKGVKGRVEMSSRAQFRFDNGLVSPWVRSLDLGIHLIAGPNSILLHSDVHIKVDAKEILEADFTVCEGDNPYFVAAWSPSHCALPKIECPTKSLNDTIDEWQKWAQKCTYKGQWQTKVKRSLITLKSLIYDPTGGMVAAPTTSLPEIYGGTSNWDYRFCWLRDATFVLCSLISVGYTKEAAKWRDWLLRAVAGSTEKLQILYGLHGERESIERELAWLKGYEASRPVRIGNGASSQGQWDVYGEVLDTLHQARKIAKVDLLEHGWDLERQLADFIGIHGFGPDHGIWEVRGEPEHYVHSKVMVWLALDRAIKSAEKFNLETDHLNNWKQKREDLHKEILERGFNKKLNSFVQIYGSEKIDASLLLLPLVGFISPSDERMRGTVKAIEERLMYKGLVWRYEDDSSSGSENKRSEGAFLACSFWYVDNLVMQNENEKAFKVLKGLFHIPNDLGLMSEEYDPDKKIFLGNFPQAYSHVGLINSILKVDNHHSANGHERV